MTLTRFWIEFVVDRSVWNRPDSSLRIGCGVTALNLDDCLSLIRARITKGEDPPEIKRIIEDVDVSTLDPRHILPNMSEPTKRGIWFPLGYEE